MKIKCLELVEGCKFVENRPKADWIDVKAAEYHTFTAPKVKRDNQTKTSYVVYDEQMVGLGFAMHLPDGVVAKLTERSSTVCKMRIEAKSSGRIDNSFQGKDDQWKLYLRGVENAEIKKGDRIAQFELCLSQYATLWQRIKWALRGKLEFVWVTPEEYHGKNRGGFGTTGK